MFTVNLDRLFYLPIAFNLGSRRSPLLKEFNRSQVRKLMKTNHVDFLMLYFSRIPEIFYDFLLYWCSWKGHIDLAKLIIDSVDVNKEYEVFIAGKDQKLVFDPDTFGLSRENIPSFKFTALDAAVHKNKEDLAELLRSRGAVHGSATIKPFPLFSKKILLSISGENMIYLLKSMKFSAIYQLKEIHPNRGQDSFKIFEISYKGKKLENPYPIPISVLKRGDVIEINASRYFQKNF